MNYSLIITLNFPLSRSKCARTGAWKRSRLTPENEGHLQRKGNVELHRYGKGKGEN